MAFWKKKTPQLTRDDSLNAVVLRSNAVNASEDDKGVITLVVPFQASPLVRRLSRFLGGGAGGGERKIELDEVGSFVWQMCDGRVAVREMVQRLSERYKLNRKEAETSLTTFIRSLASKGIVMIVVKKTKGT